MISLIYLQYHFACNCSINQCLYFFHIYLSWKFLGVDKIFLDKSEEYSWKRMGQVNLRADRCCIYSPLFSGKSDRIFCKSVLFCSANPVAMQPYFRHTSAHQPYFCHMSAFTRKYLACNSFPHFQQLSNRDLNRGQRTWLFNFCKKKSGFESTPPPSNMKLFSTQTI